MTKEEQLIYQRGYQAGRKCSIRKQSEQIDDLHRQLESFKNGAIKTQRERIYMECLEMVLRSCTNWSIGGEKVKTASSYAELADRFAKEAMKKVGGKA